VFSIKKKRLFTLETERNHKVEACNKVKGKIKFKETVSEEEMQLMFKMITGTYANHLYDNSVRNITKEMI
jgi:hypothetical protein